MRYIHEKQLTFLSCSCFVLINKQKETTMNYERILNEVAAVTALFAGAYVLLMVA